MILKIQRKFIKKAHKNYENLLIFLKIPLVNFNKNQLKISRSVKKLPASHRKNQEITNSIMTRENNKIVLVWGVF